MELLFWERVKKQIMSLYYYENSFDLTDPLKDSQGNPTEFMGHTFENWWVNLRPDINDLKILHKRSLKFHFKITQNIHTYPHKSLYQRLQLSALTRSQRSPCTHGQIQNNIVISAETMVKIYSFLAHESYKTY